MCRAWRREWVRCRVKGERGGETYFRIDEICPRLVTAPGEAEDGGGDGDGGVEVLFEQDGVHRRYCCACFM